MTTHPRGSVPALAHPRLSGGVLAGTGMACVGSSVAVSTVLVDAPLLTAQALRYAVAALALGVIAARSGRRLPWPQGRDWLWLAGVAGAGLVGFNVAVVRGVEHAEPVVLAVAVAGVPVLLAVLGPLVLRARPAPHVIAGAVVVTGGAVVVTGTGTASPAGVAWAAVLLACEAAFTVLAVPVLSRLGAWGVSFHSCWLAAAGLTVLALLVDGPGALLTLAVEHVSAVLYLAVVVTALAFVLWYQGVGRLGPAVAGLFTGVVPVAAIAGSVLLGGEVPGPVVWAGTALVAGGVVLGLVPLDHRASAVAVRAVGGSHRTAAVAVRPFGSSAVADGTGLIRRERSAER